MVDLSQKKFEIYLSDMPTNTLQIDHHFWEKKTKFTEKILWSLVKALHDKSLV